MPIEIRDNLLAELRDAFENLARPVDFAELESKGILSKAGAWYRIHKIHELPKHVSQKIIAFSQDTKGLKVKFEKNTPYHRLAKKLGMSDTK